jgi:hypothetical protein
VDGELTEAAREADLGRPRASDGGGRHTGVALTDAGTDVGAVLIGPGGFAQLAAQMGITGGTSPVKLMNGRARGKRRQSNTSAARHRPPSRVTPR